MAGRLQSGRHQESGPVDRMKAKNVLSDQLDIGNLANRSLKMIENYFDARIPEKGAAEGGDAELVQFCKETVSETEEANFARRKG